MNWLAKFLRSTAYDQGHSTGFKEGYRAGQDWGHEHGACAHTHPFDDALKVSGFGIIQGHTEKQVEQVYS